MPVTPETREWLRALGVLFNTTELDMTLAGHTVSEASSTSRRRKGTWSRLVDDMRALEDNFGKGAVTGGELADALRLVKAAIKEIASTIASIRDPFDEIGTKARCGSLTSRVDQALAQVKLLEAWDDIDDCEDLALEAIEKELVGVTKEQAFRSSTPYTKAMKRIIELDDSEEAEAAMDSLMDELGSIAKPFHLVYTTDCDLEHKLPPGENADRILADLVRRGTRALTSALQPGKLPATVHHMLVKVVELDLDDEVVKSAYANIVALQWLVPRSPWAWQTPRARSRTISARSSASWRAPWARTTRPTRPRSARRRWPKPTCSPSATSRAGCRTSPMASWAPPRPATVRYSKRR